MNMYKNAYALELRNIGIPEIIQLIIEKCNRIHFFQLQ